MLCEHSTVWNNFIGIITAARWHPGTGIAACGYYYRKTEHIFDARGMFIGLQKEYSETIEETIRNFWKRMSEKGS